MDTINTLEGFIAKHINVRIIPDAETDCWNWIGATTVDGYGRYSFWNGERTRTSHTHIITWELANPGTTRTQDDVVMHLCNNRLCCNPFHLKLGTRSQNMQYCVESGRHHQANVTHCPQGHEYTPENTGYRSKQNGRYCKKCKSLCSMEWQRRNRNK